MSEPKAAREEWRHRAVGGVFIATPYPLSRLTGIGRFVRDLSRFLEDAGIRVQIANPARAPEEPPPSNGGIVLRWRAFPSLELAIGTALRQVRARSTFQLVHVQQPHLQSLVAVLVGRLLGKPSVLTLHVRPPVAGAWLRQLGHDIITDLSLKTAAVSIAVSPFVAGTFRRYRPRVIENGVDTEFFRPSADGRQEVRERLGIGNEMAFVFAGRWTATKGLDVLLRAVDSQILNGLPFKLVLMGEATPDDPRFVERQISNLSHPSRIVVAGSISDELPAYLSAGDVFVAPSLYEGMPLAFLEAMAVGLPPLASDIPVHRLLVERSGVGWLFPTGDSTELAAAIARTIEHGVPSDWPERARATAVQHHNIRSKVKEYISTYDEVTARVDRRIDWS